MEEIKQDWKEKLKDFAIINEMFIRWFPMSKLEAFMEVEINLAVSKERERIVDIVKSTQDKYHSKDKKTKESTYSGGGTCRQCGKRRDSLEIEDIINLINTK